jgi:LPS O-antigen subunit length determinant protein (WzzB/FepE family)
LLTGLQAPQGGEGQEYVTILESFAFTTELIGKYGLANELLTPAEMNGHAFATSAALRWSAYNVMRSRFSCDYSIKTGNLTIYYVDTDSQRAQRILGYYVDGLRDKLRQREIHDSSAAVTSLQDEVRATSDTLLAQSLYELMAKQLQRKKLAQVQAEFAFTVLEPPVAPLRPFYPRVLFSSAMAMVIGGVIASMAVLFGPGRSGGSSAIALSERASQHGPTDWA